MARLLRPVTKIMWRMPAAEAFSRGYWISGLSTTGSISLGDALVAGKKRVPRPATGNTALRMVLATVMAVTSGRVGPWHVVFSPGAPGDRSIGPALPRRRPAAGAPGPARRGGGVGGGRFPWPGVFFQSPRRSAWGGRCGSGRPRPRGPPARRWPRRLRHRRPALEIGRAHV